MFRAWRATPAGTLEEGTGSLAPTETDQVVIAVEAAVVDTIDVTGSTEVIAGGAAVGTVVETGPDASHLQDARVAVGPVMPCGECDVCRRGAAAVCPRRDVLGDSVDGVLAERARARARWLCPLGAELELPGPAAALAARELADGYAMFANASVAPGEPVVIVGDNCRARMLAGVAASRGVTPVFVSAHPAAWVQDRAIVIAAGDDLASRVGSALAERGHGSAPWRIFETGGTAADRALAASLAVPGSTITFGPPRSNSGEPALDGDRLTRLGCRLVTVPAAHPDLIPEAVALAVRGDIDVAGAARIIEPADLGRTAELLDQSPHQALVVAFG
jgi:6-hydroxycyclohex-1-ene-1-carbonyl-CoA dehydrogenase